MNTVEMIKRFKLKFDRMDSESYPELYPEQIIMFLNMGVEEIEQKARELFETDQKISDDVKALVSNPTRVNATKVTGTNNYEFDLTTIPTYLYFLRGVPYVKVGTKIGKGKFKSTQIDDMDEVEDNSFHSPRPTSIPFTFAKDKIVALGSNITEIVYVDITFMRKAGVISLLNNCDLDIQMHPKVVDIAVAIAKPILKGETSPQ